MKLKFGQFALQAGIFLLVYAVPLFIPAGLCAWPAAWIFLFLWLTFWGFLLLWLAHYNPGLLSERMRVRAGDQKGWDRIFGVLINGGLFAWLLLIAFDVVRWRFSPVPVWLKACGALILLAAFYLFYATFRANAYLSPVVRLQDDRGQTVISNGPYRVVRHPMYAAMLLVIIGAPLLLGAWLGILAGAIFIGILARRAVLEERTLQAELPGYAAYLERVRFRLIPFIW